MDDNQFKSMVMNQLLAIREELGSLKGRATVWGIIGGGLVSAIISFIARKV